MAIPICISESGLKRIDCILSWARKNKTALSLRGLTERCDVSRQEAPHKDELGFYKMVSLPYGCPQSNCQFILAGILHLLRFKDVDLFAPSQAFRFLKGEIEEI
jgi:hypothetical protein